MMIVTARKHSVNQSKKLFQAGVEFFDHRQGEIGHLFRRAVDRIFVPFLVKFVNEKDRS